MPDEPIVLIPKKRIMNVCPTMLSVNLDTTGEGGRRESLILQPREKREVSEPQFQSRELQKLLSARFLVDVSASEEKRLRIEKGLKQKES